MLCNIFFYVVFMLYNIFLSKFFSIQHFNFQAATDTTDATTPATTSQHALAPARFSTVMAAVAAAVEAMLV